MQRLTAWSLIAAAALLALGCKKKSAQAVVEEVPPATATVGDTTTSLPDEPSLEKVGKAKGSAPATFHTQANAKTNSSEGAFSETGKFVVQVGVFKNRRQAKHMMEKLTAAGYPAYVADVESPTPDLSGNYHRVRIGNFATLHAAYEFGENTLKTQGYAYWIDKKKNDHRSMGAAEISQPSTPASASPANPPPASAAPAPETFSAPSSNPRPSEPANPPPAAKEPATPAPEPVGVPEPPAPSEPATPQDNSWGNPQSDTSKAPASAPAAKKDTSGAVEGW